MRAVLLLYALVLGCRGNAGAGGEEGAGTPADEQDIAAPAQHSDTHTAAAAEHAMAGMVSEDPHLRLTPLKAPASGDSARAAAILTTMRTELAKYRDIRVAEADGFRQYIPAGGAPVEHYTKLRWSFRSRNALDPARPTSLLYERAADGRLTLVGAMFTAPWNTDEAELDARLPLSVTRWHQHINWCLPGGTLAEARRRWTETKDGKPVFGPKSPIATEAACRAVGGRFRPRLFGWMAHVMAFSGDDPWNAHRH
jgi:hypothetical protein